jgi:hypothetical protein
MDKLPFQKCEICGFSAYGQQGVEWNFLTNSAGVRDRFCRYCKTRNLSCTTWVYIDEKLKGLNPPKAFHIPIGDERVIRNKLSLGDTVFLSDGNLLWRWGTNVSMTWGTFNGVFGKWKKLNPVGTVLRTSEESKLIQQAILDAYQSGHQRYIC